MGIVGWLQVESCSLHQQFSTWNLGKDSKQMDNCRLNQAGLNIESRDRIKAQVFHSKWELLSELLLVPNVESEGWGEDWTSKPLKMETVDWFQTNGELELPPTIPSMEFVDLGTKQRAQVSYQMENWLENQLNWELNTESRAQNWEDLPKTLRSHEKDSELKGFTRHACVSHSPFISLEVHVTSHCCHQIS